MRLKDIKYKRKEDEIVLKILFRCLKEDFCFKGIIKSLKELISHDSIMKRCINSRLSHPNEPFLINITYWPSDIGYTLSTSTRLLYLSMLINKLKLKNGDKDSHKIFAEFENYFSCTDTNIINIKEACSTYQHEIKLAARKVFSQKKYKLFDKIMEGVENEIPF